MTARKPKPRRRKPEVCTRYALRLNADGTWLGIHGERQPYKDNAHLFPVREEWMSAAVFEGEPKYEIVPVRCHFLSARTKAAKKRTR